MTTTTDPMRDQMQELLDALRASLANTGVPAGITGPDRAGPPLLEVRGRECRRHASVSFIDDQTRDIAVWVEIKGPLDLDELGSFIEELRYMRDVTRRCRDAEQTQGGAA